MPFEMTLWRVSGSTLDPIAPAQFEQEQRLEIGSLTILQSSEWTSHLSVGKCKPTSVVGLTSLHSIDAFRRLIAPLLKFGPRSRTGATAFIT